MLQEMTARDLTAFVNASNAIEGEGLATEQELNWHFALIDPNIPLNVEWVCKCQAGIKTDAPLRGNPGMNVRIGSHFPPKGGPGVVHAFERLLADINNMPAIVFYTAFQNLHPFMDGNGRIGRTLYLRLKLNIGADTSRLFAGHILEDFHYAMLRAYDQNYWAEFNNIWLQP